MRVKIENIDLLIQAFFENNGWRSWYIDAMSGEIISFDNDNIRRWSKLNSKQEINKKFSLTGNDLLGDSIRKEWNDKADREDDKDVWRSIEEDRSGRYFLINPFETWRSYNIMRDFIEIVKDIKLKDKLLQSINGKGAFRRFKEVLLEYPVWRENGSNTKKMQK